MRQVGTFSGMHLRSTAPRAGGSAGRLSAGFSGVLMLAIAMSIALTSAPALAQGHPELEANARAALTNLTSTVPAARYLEGRALAVLVFPDITKAGFLIGGEYGNGVMFQRGRIAGFYNTAGVSYGLQAGVQTFGYAMFFMNERALMALNSRDGFQVGIGPSVVVMNQGKSRSITSDTLTEDVYAFVFGEQGLMAGVGLEGTKITKLNR